MVFDRRAFLFTVAGAIASVGCSWSDQAPSAVSSDGWLAVKLGYFNPDGRVVDTGNGNISHSEGQGYGMLLAALADDKASFEAMFEWTESQLARDDVALYSWRYDPAKVQPVDDPNNATDGDILIAWALLIAGQRWNVPAYLKRSKTIRSAIKTNLVVEREGLSVLLPGLEGFDFADRTTLNPAYYVWPALDAFRTVDGSGQWSTLIEDGETLMNRARFGALFLPTDWIDLLAEARVEPALGHPARFGFDAVRIPLYLLLSGRGERTKNFAQFWAAYLQQERPIPAWVDVRTGETAPYPLSNGALKIASRVTGLPVNTQRDTAVVEDYYSNVLGALAGIPALS